LSPTNKETNDFNDLIMDRLKDHPSAHNSQSYFSHDSIVEEITDHFRYPPEVLNSFDVNGLPPHHLRLHVGVPVMLLRNMGPDNSNCWTCKREDRLLPSSIPNTFGHGPSIHPQAPPISCARVLRDDHQQEPGSDLGLRWPVPTSRCIQSRPGLCCLLQIRSSRRYSSLFPRQSHRLQERSVSSGSPAVNSRCTR
jgi:hypothetical protein